jgi:hypothetical protein
LLSPEGGAGAGRVVAEELVESWTLVGDDWKRVGHKSGATRLGFAVLLKFFELQARFPRAASDVPPGAVAYVAEQVGVRAARARTRRR